MGKDQPLLIISTDDGRAYSKPLLSTALSKGKTATELASADAETMAQQLNAEIRTHTRVSAIDSNHHKITLDNNEELHYAKLVLALGADPFRPPLAGDSGKVLSVNDLEDYTHFRQVLDGKKTVAILGGGLIGCEFANDLISNGYQVTLIDRNSSPLSALLPKAISEKLLAKLQALGLQWHGNTTASHIKHSAKGFELHLENDQRVQADVVLSAIGLRARTTLAKEMGLKVNRGITVDTFLQTSNKDIYALGDCAEVAGHLLPFIMPLMLSTRALARTLTGTATAVKYPAMPVTLKTPVYPISVLPPPVGLAGHWQTDWEGDSVQALFHDENNQLRGFALANKTSSEARHYALEIPGLI